MYSGFNKSGGDVIGRVVAGKSGGKSTNRRGSSDAGNSSNVDDDIEREENIDNGDEDEDVGCAVSLPDAAHSTAAEESFLAVDENGEPVSFKAYLDENSGELSWRPADMDRVLARTVSMSQMTSMLRDKDRCDLYERALAICIAKFIEEEGRQPKVLDIGTGTGLLAMMAVRHGAESVKGCEMFTKMAQIATQVVSDNGVADRITVIPDKSSAFEDELQFADIIVSELLDSALLGESCMYSHADAIDRLYKEDLTDASKRERRVIPHSAFVFGTLVQSEDVKGFRDIDNVMLHGCSPYRDNYSDNLEDINSSSNSNDNGNCSRNLRCSGGSPLIPAHWAELQKLGGKAVSSTKRIMDVEFFHGSNDSYNVSVNEEGELEANFRSSQETKFEILESGTVHGVLAWWELNLLSSELDPERKCVYSTAPESGLCWQDHWVQVVFPLSEPIECSAGDELVLKCSRSDIQMWFEVRKVDISDGSNEGSMVSSIDVDNDSQDSSSTTKKPRKDLAAQSAVLDNNDIKNEDSSVSYIEDPKPCDCGWHMLFGAEKIHLMNDPQRQRAWSHSIAQIGSYLNSLVLDSANESAQEGEGEEQLNASELPDSITISQHPHALSKGICPYPGSAYGCDLCGLAGASWVYSCSDCGFDVHPNCARAHSMSSLADKSASLRTPGQDKLLCLDVGDGSIMSIGLSNYLMSLQSGKEHSSSNTNLVPISENLSVVSMEKKEFSKIFFNGLVNSNNLHEIMNVWDGNDFNDLSYFTKRETESESDADEEEACEVGSPFVHLLLSECFYFQLNSLPVWEAISFYYQRRSLAPVLHERALVCPHSASVMIAAVELPDLSISHGTVTAASGFDHRALDAVQNDWHSFVFPYRVASYRHSLLTDPTCVSSFNFSDASHETSESMSLKVTKAGCLHGIVIWVDYQLLPDALISDTSDPSLYRIENAKDGKFHYSYKTNIRFIPLPRQVSVGEMIEVIASYTIGDSEVSIDFKK